MSVTAPGLHRLFTFPRSSKSAIRGEERMRCDCRLAGRTLLHCNNTLLGRYDDDLKVLVDAISRFCETKLVLPLRSPELPIRCRPRAILQSVLGHLLAAKSITDESGHLDVALRPSIMDPTVQFPTGYTASIGFIPIALRMSFETSACRRFAGACGEVILRCSQS